MSSRRTGILYGLIASAIWGGMYVISKVVLEVIPPFALLSMRLLLGAAALGSWVFWRKGFPRLTRAQWLEFLAVGVLGYGISLGFQLTGTKLSTAANGSVITAATPAFVYLFAWILLREPVTRRRLLALIVSTIGVLVVIDPSQAQINAGLWLGNLLLVGAAVTWALYSVLVRRATHTVETLPFTLIAFIGGMLVAFPATALELSAQTIGPITLPLAAGVLYLGIISMAVSAYLWNRAFKLLEAGAASLTFFAQPIVGAGLGAVFLNEQLTSLFIAGTALILLGLWVAAREDRIPTTVRRE